MQSVPYFSTLALPIGIMKFGSITSGDRSNSMLYIISFSRNMTGVLDLIADLRSPILSSALHGDIVYKPGHEPYHAAKHYEC